MLKIEKIKHLFGCCYWCVSKAVGTGKTNLGVMDNLQEQIIIHSYVERLNEIKGGLKLVVKTGVN